MIIFERLSPRIVEIDKVTTERLSPRIVEIDKVTTDVSTSKSTSGAGRQASSASLGSTC
jgi:hypothetical protein